MAILDLQAYKQQKAEKQYLAYYQCKPSTVEPTLAEGTITWQEAKAELLDVSGLDLEKLFPEE